MTSGKYVVFATLVAVASAAWAQQDTNVQVMKAPGTATIQGAKKVTATVQEIDAVLDEVAAVYAGFEFEKTPIELINYHEKCPV